MDELLLTDDETAKLTGYKQRAKQIAQLKGQRIPFTLDRYGRPRVARAVVEGRHKAHSKAETTSWSPSWAGVLQRT